MELWRACKETGDPRSRERLVLTLAPIVKYIVFRKINEVPPHCDVEDFISAGLEALLQSIDRYDPDKGATLEQFAWVRINGAVIDELRRNDWAPRSLRRWEREINELRDRFTAIHGRAPSQVELAEAAGVSHTEFLARLDDLDRADVTSLNALVAGDEDFPIERIDSVHSADRGSDPEFSAMRQ